MTDNFNLLKSIKIESRKWNFSDVRINIPPMSLGSDASNPHTQYSNAIAVYTESKVFGIGACFTLGDGNQFVCAAAERIVSNLDGKDLNDLLESKLGLAETLGNPLQLRWLSPNAGLPLMAAGLILNTLIDFASKKAGLPAWKFLASLDINELFSLLSFRHIKNSSKIMEQLIKNDPAPTELHERIEELESSGLPAYFTTWIGSEAKELVEEIKDTHIITGISKFKVKIGSDVALEQAKIENILRDLPEDFSFAADANQRLDYTGATKWLEFLSTKKFLWLEEPFAPDNILLFRELARERQRQKWTCEIATGENCPNLHTAHALLDAGIGRFQADPCRMLGITDGAFSGVLADLYQAKYTPHAGGAGLDEMSSHMHYFLLAKLNHKKPIEESLTEYIGFCSKFYAFPSVVVNGMIKAPKAPGLLVGLAPKVTDKLIPFKEGVLWLEP
jgi:L-alanine-DL-glutamate epimerase-like enolase superfamily enzyme